MISRIRKHYANRRAQDDARISRILMSTAFGFTAYQLRGYTKLRTIRVYRSVDRLMAAGLVEDSWASDHRHPDRPARRFYVWIGPR